MIITPMQFRVDSSIYGIDTHKRSPGLHISTIINKIVERLGKSKFRDDLDEQALESYRLLGFAWERVLILQLPHLKKLGEIRKQVGKTWIIGTPDPVNQDDWSLEEWKCTWRSISNLVGKGHPVGSNFFEVIAEMDPEEIQQNYERNFFNWSVQQKAYCYILNMDMTTNRTMFVNGDYAANRRPVPVALRMQYQRQELANNWDMLVQTADQEGWIEW